MANAPKSAPRDLSVKAVPPNRSSRRLWDRAAKACGLRTGPWLVSLAQEASKPLRPSKTGDIPVVTTYGAPSRADIPVLGTSDLKDPHT